jgi:hypothetical protein
MGVCGSARSCVLAAVVTGARRSPAGFIRGLLAIFGRRIGIASRWHVPSCATSRYLPDEGLAVFRHRPMDATCGHWQVLHRLVLFMLGEHICASEKFTRERYSELPWMMDHLFA